MQSPHLDGKKLSALTAGAYLLLLGVYLLYWNHVEFYIDDWFLLGQFRRAIEHGLPGAFGFVVSVIRNNVYRVFRVYWLSTLYGFLTTWPAGYSVKLSFALLLLLHAGCAWLLCQALARLGLGRGMSFLAGALFLLAPTTHYALFTNFTNPFFNVSTFWVLLLLWSFAGRLRTGRWGCRAVMFSCFCAVAAMFSGEQVFLLAWVAAPVAVWCFAARPLDRRAGIAVATTWAALGAAAGAYVLWINRAPMAQAGFNLRYEWTWTKLGKNIALISSEMSQLSGFTSDALFHLAPGGIDIALAAGAAAVTAALVWYWRAAEPADTPLWRFGVFAAAGLVAAYGPVLWIAGDYPRIRYHYVPSPYLAVAGAAVCGIFAGRTWLRAVAALLGGAVIGFFTLNAAADIRQCWIPQSEHHRALEARLRKLKNVAPDDILVISGTPYNIGTAQHFSLHSRVSANPFAEQATGAAPLEVARELLDLHGKLVLYQRLESHRHVTADDLRRAHVLVSSSDGTFSSRDWIAQETEPGKFRLLPLKGASLPAGVERATFSREQLALMEGRIYFPKSVSASRPGEW